MNVFFIFYFLIIFNLFFLISVRNFFIWCKKFLFTFIFLIFWLFFFLFFFFFNFYFFINFFFFLRRVIFFCLFHCLIETHYLISFDWLFFIFIISKCLELFHILRRQHSHTFSLCIFHYFHQIIHLLIILFLIISFKVHIIIFQLNF